MLKFWISILTRLFWAKLLVKTAKPDNIFVPKIASTRKRLTNIALTNYSAWIWVLNFFKELKSLNRQNLEASFWINDIKQKLAKSKANKTFQNWWLVGLICYLSHSYSCCLEWRNRAILTLFLILQPKLLYIKSSYNRLSPNILRNIELVENAH